MRIYSIEFMLRNYLADIVGAIYKAGETKDEIVVSISASHYRAFKLDEDYTKLVAECIWILHALHDLF